MSDITSISPLERSLVHVADLLRCAAAVAYETGDTLNGTKRDLVFSVMHMLCAARKELEQTLASIEAR
jgi:hypothetical protein